MIQRDDRDEVRILRLTHGKVSAMDLEFGQALADALQAAAADPIRAVIVTGSGSSFSAGVDLFRVINDGPDYVRRFLPVLDRLLRTALTLPKPLIAAVNGHAIAGGCILAAACDRRIMVDGNGRIGIPELAVGVPFPALPLQIMVARLADGPLRDLVFSGRTVQVDEARTMGLVDEKCPSGLLLDRAMEVAQKLAGVPARAFALTKAGFYQPILDRAAHLSAINDQVAEVWLQPETHQTIRTYLEKTVGKK